jgi:hypothetical protein
MKLFEDFMIKFERPDWSRNLELGLIIYAVIPNIIIIGMVLALTAIFLLIK